MANDVMGIEEFKIHFQDFLTATSEERVRAESRRDYRDLKQWTESQAQVLESRGQAAIVFDQFGKKVDAICGLEVDSRTDPKAFPLKRKEEKAADAITDALRYVELNTGFDALASEVFEDKIVEGYGGVIVEYNPKKKRIEINQLYWDRIYYDSHSRRKDFKDATYVGITLWMDKSDAVQRWPDSKEQIEGLIGGNNGDDGLTFEDRPTWVDTKRKRLRVNQEYYVEKDVWHEVFYAGDTILTKAKPSPYLDCDGEPSNPIELQSDFTDRENNRYGYVERLKDPQDEINHRRSKALFLLSSKTVIADRGAFGDTPRQHVLDELKKGDTFLEPMKDARVEIDSQTEIGATQFQFYQDAQNAMDSIGINPELTGGTENAISGRAFQARQQGGMVELKRMYARHSEWKKRVYIQQWARIKQFWDEPKWIRVGSDPNSMKFIGINVPIRAIDKILEKKSGMSIDDLMEEEPQTEAFIEQAIAQDPRLAEVVETRNDVSALNMDIDIENAPDSISIQHEQFEVLANLVGTGADREMFVALLELSDLPKKDEVLEKFKGSGKEEEQKAQAQQEQQELQKEAIMAELENKQADTAPLKQAQTIDEMASAKQRLQPPALTN